MASLGHVAAGMAAARVYHDGRPPRWPSMALWSALSLLPDADVIGLSMGVEYGDRWGHRGATHSFAFSLVAGLAAGLVARWFKRPAMRTAVCATLLLATHPVLDTMADGGLGCALLWPLDLTRYFAPWRPIQVAPIGLDFFTPYGAIVALSEVVLFLPLFVFALRQTSDFQLRTFGVVSLVWLVAAWLVASDDPVREATVGVIVRENTTFAPGFSEKAFRNVTIGQSESAVRQTLGPPLEESWHYPPQGQNSWDVAASDARSCAAVHFEHGGVSETFPRAVCEASGIAIGASMFDVERRLGAHAESCLTYSKGSATRAFRLRLVCFTVSKVAMVARRWIL